MGKLSQEEYKAKLDKFIEYYLGEAEGNSAEAARLAGWAASRASQTGYELVNKNEYVISKIGTYQKIQKDQNTDGTGSVDEIFESTSSEALSTLAREAKTDPKAAKLFWDLKLKRDGLKKEVLGELEGLNTTELIRRINDQLSETEELVQRAVEAFGTEAV